MNETQTPAPPPHKWYAALDGYRGLAVLAVVAFHSDIIPGGWLGVDLFFVLSGFLITRIILREKTSSGKLNMKTFWIRRARRLLPALALFFVGVAIFTAWYPNKELLPANLPAQFIATVAYVANWFTVFSQAGYWDQYAAPSPLQHMWSLAIEEQFYIIFPLVAAALLAVKKRAVFGLTLAALTLLSWSWAITLLATGTSFERVYLGTDTRMAAITLGAFVGYLTTINKFNTAVQKVSLLAIPAFLTTATMMILLSGEVEWSATRWLAVIGFELCVVFLLAAAIQPNKNIPNAVISWKPFVWFGAISYGLYLWHIPIQLAAQQVLSSQSKYVIFIVVLTLSTAVAYASLKLVEHPIRTQGLNAFKKLHLPKAAGLTSGLALTALAFLIVSSATLPARQSIEEKNNAAQGEAIIAAPPPPQVNNSMTSTTPSVTQPPQNGLLRRTPGVNPRVTLLGDSMVYHMGEWFIKDQEALGVTASTTSFIGCGAGGMETTDKDPGLTPEFIQNCQNWLDGLPQTVADSQPDAILIVRVAHRYATPELGGEVCSATFRSWYKNAVVNEIRSFAPTNAPVFLTTSVYYRPPGMTNTESLRENDREVDCINEEKRKAAEETGATVIELNNWMCDSQRRCKDYIDGTLLRSDGLHFRDEGNSVALRWIISQIYEN